MDSVTQMDVLEKAKSVMTLDERRAKLSLKRISGGDTIYLQQQDHSLEAIAARDSMLIDAAKSGPPDRKSTRLNSSHVAISYAVFCLKKKKKQRITSQQN